MNRAGDFLCNVIRRIGRPEATLAWLESAWPSIAGPQLASHTRPLRCADHRLEIAVDHPAWEAQLAGMEQDLRERVNQAWGGNLVREMKLSVTVRRARIPREIDNSHTPFIRRRRS